MRKLLFCGAALLALAGCAERADTGAAIADAATPELGSFGIETAHIDDSVRPGDDFFRHVNGGWLDTFELPDDFSNYGSFTVLFERSEERVKSIIEDAASARAPAGSIEQKIGDLFASYVDVEAINAKGLDPVAADLARIAAIETHEQAANAMADRSIATNSPFGAFVNVDSGQPDRYSVYFAQAGLGLPNREYYFDEKYADKRPKYRDHIARMLALAGIEDAPEKAQAIFDLETRMAQAHWEPAKSRNRDLTYNPKSRAELLAFAPEAPWDVMLEAAGLASEEHFILVQYDAISELAKIFADTPVETWRAYMTFHLLNANAAVLPKAFDEAHFEFFGKELTGTIAQRERWKRGVAAVNASLGEAVGKIYVERHFPPESKAKMEELVANLRLALAQRLDALDWMSEETKVEARTKLEKFTPKIGYPDKWRDYSGLTVVRGDAYGNAKRAAEFAWNYSKSRLGGPIDTTEWAMTPQTVNAYYSPPRNEIVFPAAILQPPFFDPNADPAVNYGGIGGVIGHEIGHGFDDQGRKSDGDGKLRDWWTAEDAANFQKLADKLGAQYAQFEPVPGFRLNPQLTMGENIGDLGGLAMAYHAYKLSLNGEEAPIIDGYTGDQRFFMAWAQVWMRKAREEQIKNQVTTGPHSPAEYRTNGIVRNMDAWYEAFGVAPGDALYLPPKERVQIW